MAINWKGVAAVAEPVARHTSPRTTWPQRSEQAAVAAPATEPTCPGTGHTRCKPDCRMRRPQRPTSHMQHTDRMRTEWAAGTAPPLTAGHRSAGAAEEQAAVSAALLMCAVAAPDKSLCGKCRYRSSGNWTSVAEELRPIRPSVTDTPHRFSLHWHWCFSFPYSRATRDPPRRSWNRSRCS